MICYGDRTWCPFWETCKDKCERALTAEVKADAEKWWGESNPPICIWTEKPECWKELK